MNPLPASITFAFAGISISLRGPTALIRPSRQTTTPSRSTRSGKTRLPVKRSGAEAEAAMSLDRNESIFLRVDFDPHILVFVEQARVVHLPRDGAGFACGRIVEAQDFDPARAYGLCDSHPRRAGFCVHQYFHLRPSCKI